eukprot:3474688-Pleurochrysis_carterae.AAC.1
MDYTSKPFADGECSSPCLWTIFAVLIFNISQAQPPLEHFASHVLVSAFATFVILLFQNSLGFGTLWY